MDNLIVLFSNLKGGTGKTTLCSLFSTFCVENSIPVAVLDADTQLSLFHNRQSDLWRDGIKTPWNVFRFRVDDTVEERLKKVKRNPFVIVIDCPGTVDNPWLQHIFRAADIAVMPFRFDHMNVRETTTFADLFTRIGKARIFFQPNLVTQYDDKRESLRLAMDTANRDLTKYGRILPGIADCLAIRDSNTLGMNYKQRSAVRNGFTPIIEEIKKLRA